MGQGLKVAKFGGSSLADARQFLKVKAIVEADPARRFVVPSAPGKRNDQDRKITDLLYLCQANAAQAVPIDAPFSVIRERFVGIVNELGIELDIEPALEEIQTLITGTGTGAPGASAAYAASRGEYLNGLILAKLLNFRFVDAADVVRFDANGRFDRVTTRNLLAKELLGSADTHGAVIPGFYGADPTGTIHTFSRGGSDVSGALVAQAVDAQVYENWTDVSGLLMADPRIVQNPAKIDMITYRELRELAYMGATVLHDEAIFPVREAGIPVNIRNTNQPDDPGTLIVADTNREIRAGQISGVAGRRNFTVITIEKTLMNSEIGFGRRVLSIFENHRVSYEHTPTGIDTMGVVVADDSLKGKLEDILADINAEIHPDAVTVDPDLALIATVGRGMARTPGMSARLFTALANAHVNVRMIDQGSSELNIIVGVNEHDFAPAVRAIYAAFVQ